MSGSPIRIATRASQLALWQANHVADRLRSADPDVQVELVHVSTQGDRDQSGPLVEFGGIGVFTREVQRTVLEGRAEITVHSLKDLPTVPVEGLTLAGIPERAPHFDALVLPASADEITSLDQLSPKARIGTGSLRRRAQLLHRLPQLQMHEVRGNVDTRLRKLDDGGYDAIVLAEAGLRRLGLEDRISLILQPPVLFPAVGQGALGLECRSDDSDTIARLAQLTDAPTKTAVLAERALLAELRAGCHAPVGVSTEVSDARITLEAVVLSPDGQERIAVTVSGESDSPGAVGIEAAGELRQLGAQRLMDAAEG